MIKRIPDDQLPKIRGAAAHNTCACVCTCYCSCNEHESYLDSSVTSSCSRHRSVTCADMGANIPGPVLT